jgi:phosphoribosylglycinamide formyltransferase 1
MSLAILASGNGSNLTALLEASHRGEIPEVALVIANQPCRAIERAIAASVPARVIPHAEFASREDFDRALLEAVRSAGADLICLAGFMRLLTPTMLDAFPGRVMNIHPSLLPAFPGLHAQRQALAAGVRLAGCSVHFVDRGTDTGALIAQAAVRVLASDTEATLSERILAQEHRIYPAAVGWVARGNVHLVAGRVVADPELWTGTSAAGVLHSPPT